MERKTARLTLLIDPNKKAAFEWLCARQDRTPSQIVRQLIRDYLAQHDVHYVGSGVPEALSDVVEMTPPPMPGAGPDHSSRLKPRPPKRKRA
ncbi:MAG: CopG family transcriptional regulator [Betaproteobacteria bacterium]